MSSFSYAASHRLSGYAPPGYNRLRGPLLEQEKKNVQNFLLPIQSSWQEKGVSIVSNGWSDSQRRPLINFMAGTKGGPMFLNDVDCSGAVKDKYFITALLKRCILEVGVANVIQVITDNVANCAAAGRVFEKEFPHILWTPRVVHSQSCVAEHVLQRMLRTIVRPMMSALGYLLLSLMVL